MISEEHLESTLLAIRAIPLLEAREMLREFAVSCRQQGMLDFATSIQVKVTSPGDITINDLDMTKVDI